jgi:hypothetical protein
MRWKRIRGFPNYKISNRGDVYSIPRPKTKGGILQPDRTNGYRRIGLYNEDGYSKILIHILVLKHFKKRRKGRTVCIHKDGNKANNRSSNLRWGTFSDALKLGYDLGLRHCWWVVGGEEHPRAKLTEFDVKQIRELSDYGVQGALLAEMYEMGRTIIYDIIHRRRWKEV